MKKVVRKGVFETNSSSAHAFAFVKKSADMYPKYENENKITKITDNEDKILVILSAFDLARKNAKNTFMNWLNEDVGGRFDDYEVAYNFADEVCKLADYEKIAELLKSTPELGEEFLLSQPFSDIWNITYEDPYLSLVHEEFFKGNIIGTKDTVEFTKCIEKVIDAYAQYLNEDRSKVEERIEDNRYSRDDCLAECLFEEGEMDDCNCGIDDFISEWAKSHSLETLEDITENTKKLVLDLMNDELCIFQAEAYGMCYCSIKSIIDGTSLF